MTVDYREVTHINAAACQSGESEKRKKLSRGSSGQVKARKQAATPQTVAQLMIADGTTTQRDATIAAASRVTAEPAHEVAVTTATTHQTATASRTAPTTTLNTTWTASAQWG